MARFGFCGGAYRSQSVNADAQRCVNLYPENDESGAGKSAVVLYPTPGLKLFVTSFSGPTFTPPNQVRGLFQCTVGGMGQQCFAVVNDELFQVNSNGVATLLGTVENDFKTVSWAVNNANQLIVCSGGYLYLAPLNSQATQAGTQSIATASYVIQNFQGNIITGLAVAPNSPTSGVSTVTVACSDALNFGSGATIIFAGMTLNPNAATLNGYSTGSLTILGTGQFSFVYPGVLTTYSGTETGGCCIVGSPAYATVNLASMPVCDFLDGNQVKISGTGTEIDGDWTLLQVTLTPTQQITFQTGTLVPTGSTTAVGTASSAAPVPLTSLTMVNQSEGPFSFVEFMDGYFIALVANSQKFVISQLEDGSTWDAADVAQVEEFPDNVLSMIVSDELLWFLGATRSIPYYDSGAALFPFTPVQNVLIEQGIAAPRSRVRLDNSIFWIGQDERGQGIAWRANGYTPVRVSTHAIEFAWSQYSTIADAVGYSYQDQGHSFWVICFPTAQATWVYDVATGLWHQRDNWVNGISKAHPSWVHAYCFGKHLVGDPFNANIYDMSLAYVDNDGTPKRWVRAAPHVSVEQKRLTYNQLQLYVESGIGPDQPTGGMPFGNTEIDLQDAAGNWWAVTVDNNGILHSTAISASAATPGDWTLIKTLDGTLWQLGIDAVSQRLTATEVTSAYLPAEVISFVSPNRLQWGLSILQSGQLLVNQQPLPIGPQIILRWSKDGGHSWSGEHLLSYGRLGEYKYRCVMRRMGHARDMVFEASGTGLIRIIDAYLEATPAFQPSERLAHQLLKVQ